MTDENNVKKANMPSNHLKQTLSLDRKAKPASLNIPQSPNINAEFDFAPLSPFSDPGLSSCSSMSSLNQDESNQNTLLSPSLSMSSLQQDDRRRRISSRHNHIHHLSLSPSLSMSSLTQSGRPRSLMENILIAKMERATLGGASLVNGYVSPSTKSLMRTDSLGSTSSFTSTSSFGSDYCRCDDCLLGIVDLSVDSSQQVRRNKVLILTIYKYNCYFVV
ncbi:hypothetical protein PGB90_004292 [Kerria lacca]